MEEVYLVSLGSVLALVTSFVVENYKGWNNSRDLTKNFKTVLKLELKNLVSLVDRLSDGYANKSFYPILLIDQLDRQLERFETLRKNAIYLKSDSEKEEVLVFFNDVYTLYSDMRASENYAFATGITDEERVKREKFVEKDRQLMAIRIIDLKRRIQDILNRMEK